MKIKKYMEEQGIKGEFLEFSESCHTAEDAQKAAGAKSGEVIKNVCLTDGNRVINCIVIGSDRVSTTRVGELLKIGRPRIATREEVLEKTGYPVGGVPSFGYEATAIIDENVMKMPKVYTSGGTENTLVRIEPEELKRASSAIVGRIRK